MDAALAVVALVLNAAAVYYAYVQVRGTVRRRRSPAPTPVTATEHYDAFISYAEPDADSAQRLALALRGAGLRVFLARWIEVGQVRLLEKENALLGSANGVLLFSSTTMGQPAIRDEYASLLTMVHSGGRTFVPVLVGDVTDLPPFAAIREPLDLRHVVGDDYDEQVARLARALRPRSAT